MKIVAICCAIVTITHFIYSERKLLIPTAFCFTCRVNSANSIKKCSLLPQNEFVDEQISSLILLWTVDNVASVAAVTDCWVHTTKKKHLSNDWTLNIIYNPEFAFCRDIYFCYLFKLFVHNVFTRCLPVTQWIDIQNVTEFSLRVLLLCPQLLLKGNSSPETTTWLLRDVQAKLYIKDYWSALIVIKGESIFCNGDFIQNGRKKRPKKLGESIIS